MIKVSKNLFTITGMDFDHLQVGDVIFAIGYGGKVIVKKYPTIVKLKPNTWYWRSYCWIKRKLNS